MLTEKKKKGKQRKIFESPLYAYRDARKAIGGIRDDIGTNNC